MTKPERRLLLDALLLGVFGALAAQLFTRLLGVAQTLFLDGITARYEPAYLWRIPFATTLGGLLSGLLTYGLAPEAEGHGTDTVVAAFHRAGGILRARVAPVKTLASSLTIGSGGSGGREGPTALISAGIASVYSAWGDRSDDERRLLLLTGMAAGLSAIFRSPIGSAVFAIEVLYHEMDFEADALVYTMLAAIVAYTVNGAFESWEPLFRVPMGLRVNSEGYVLFVLLGLLAGVVGAALPLVFYTTRDVFRRLPLPPHLKPALGGLGVGLVALALPQVLGGGYGGIQDAIDGRLTPWLLLASLFAKMVSLSLTISSGGSGGVFAPSLYIGAMLGGLVAAVSGQPPAPYVVVGMVAVFGSAARVPIATLLMVVEMTAGYELLVPATLAVMLGYLVQIGVSAPLRYRSLYEAQVAHRGNSPAHRAAHLRIAMDLIRRHQVPRAATVGHVALVNLLESGVPVDLPGQRRVVMKTLQPDDPNLGKPLRGLVPDRPDVETIGLLRDGTLLLPEADALLRSGDRLLMIVPAKGSDRA